MARKEVQKRAAQIEPGDSFWLRVTAESVTKTESAVIIAMRDLGQKMFPVDGAITVLIDE